MSRKLYVAAVIALITFAGCKKDDSNPNDPGTLPARGTLTYKNTSADRYDIYLDDFRLGDLYGNSSVSYPGTTTGFHAVRAVQTANINGPATMRTQQVVIYKDTVTTFSFP